METGSPRAVQPPLFPHQFPHIRLSLTLTASGPDGRAAIGCDLQVWPDGETVALTVLPSVPLDDWIIRSTEMLRSAVDELLANLAPF